MVSLPALIHVHCHSCVMDKMLLKMDGGNALAHPFQVNLMWQTACHAGSRDIPGKRGNGSRETD